MTTHRLILNETSYHGPGAIRELVSEVKNRGLTKALIVTDKPLVEHGVVAKVTDLLDAAGLAYATYDGVMPNPTVGCVNACLAMFKDSGADYLIAIGGGSPMDAAKGAAIIAANPEFADVVSLEGAVTTPNPCVPLIAIPTTAGSASETTTYYVITDESRRRKFISVDAHCIPVIAIIDPDMMASMPPGLRAATGMDALTHAIEAYVTRAAWEMSDFLCLKAIKLIYGSLRKAMDGDAAAQKDMALAQYVAGMAFSNVGLGLVHGTAHPLSAFYNIPHGEANAILLPHVMAFNAAEEAAADKFRNVACAMGVDVNEMCCKDAAQAAIDTVKRLSASVGIPPNLAAVGVLPADIPALAASAMQDPCTAMNPRDCTQALVEEVYRKAYEG